MKIIICIFALTALTLANDTDLQKLLKDSNDQFTAQMFNEVVKANPDKSFVLSAFSVLSPLAQLVSASVGESHNELLKAIGLPDDNVTIAVMTNLNRQIRAVKGVTLELANKIYVADGFVLNERFAVLSKDVFNTEVQNLNFGNRKESAKAINAWVEDHTNQRIKDLVTPDSLDGTTVSVIVNAIYFKGSWNDKFVKGLTEDRPFHVTKDKTIQVPTMYRRGDYAYGESPELDAKLLEIPYEGEESSFLIVLPNNVDGIQALKNKLKDYALLERAQQNMYTREVDLYLPKFKIETTTDLKEILINMNVKKIFSGDAQLYNLLKDTSAIAVSDAIQKAFIEINEEGAEAAAANAFGIAYLSAVISEPKIFKADRPYVFFLKHGNIILFAGVYNP